MIKIKSEDDRMVLKIMPFKDIKKINNKIFD